MKTLSTLFIFIALLTTQIAAQNNSVVPSFLERSTFKLSTDFINQPVTPNSFWVPTDFFESTPSIGLEMDYALTTHFVIGSALTFSGTSSESIGVLDYFIRPEDDAHHTIRTVDRFRSLSLDPKAELHFSLSNFDFFWSAGPILSFANLQSTAENSTFENPKNFNSTSSSSSRSFGLGAQASTGVQYFITKKIGLSFEIGYKTLTHNSLYTQHDFGMSKESVTYDLNSVFQRVGLIFKF